MSYFIYQSKKIYYTEMGNGKPVVFLHGNTAFTKELASAMAACNSARDNLAVWERQTKVLSLPSLWRKRGIVCEK